MRNIKLTIEYEGTHYLGWQRQPQGMTVQQAIEEAIEKITGAAASVTGAGRTDAGVHAAGQVANFHTTNLRIPTDGLRRAVNSRLPRDIAIRSVAEVPQEFHASRSAVGKTYRYRIYTAPVRPVELAGQVYHYWRLLDVEPMQAAGRRLIGTHDFRGFTVAGEQREDTVRTITRCEVARGDNNEIHVTVQGGGFLYRMVRIIVGTLVEIGRGHWAPQRINTILSSRDRRDAGPTALPDGLSLICVHYDPESLV